MITGMHYADGFHLPIQGRAYSGRMPVIGMPYRPFYEADEGWEDLMLSYVHDDVPVRQGAVAANQPKKAPPTEQRPPRDRDERHQETEDRL